jgi:hypothetical protein
MKTKASILTISIFTVLFVTVFTYGVKAQNSDSDISKQNRTTNEFKGIKVSEGIEVFLSQGDETSVVVETYNDKQEVVKTVVKDGILKIYIDGRYNRNKSPKVYVSNPVFESITGSSASSVKCETVVKGEKLYLDFSSAASLAGTFTGKEINCDFSSASSVKLTVTTPELYIEISSGSDAEIEGTADKFLLNASSGSDINAFDLISKKCTARVSSGADININVEEELIGKASSGSQITFKGKANMEFCSTSSGAEIDREE